MLIFVLSGKERTVLMRIEKLALQHFHAPVFSALLWGGDLLNAQCLEAAHLLRWRLLRCLPFGSG